MKEIMKVHQNLKNGRAVYTDEYSPMGQDLTHPSAPRALWDRTGAFAHNLQGKLQRTVMTIRQSRLVVFFSFVLDSSTKLNRLWRKKIGYSLYLVKNSSVYFDELSQKLVVPKWISKAVKVCNVSFDKTYLLIKMIR